MDQKIIRALAALGLSEERITEFSTIVDGIKDRVRSEGLITRKRTPLVTPKATVVPKTPKRRIVVSYKPGNGPGRSVADEVAMLERRLQRDDVPCWQRQQHEARLDALRRTGKTMPQMAQTTLAHLPGATR